LRAGAQGLEGREVVVVGGGSWLAAAMEPVIAPITGKGPLDAGPAARGGGGRWLGLRLAGFLAGKGGVKLLPIASPIGRA
jgi:hypothetical protein